MKESWKYVSILNCIKIIIGCLIFSCVLFIPFAFTEEGMVLTYKLMPIFGDGSLTESVLGTWITESAIAIFPVLQSLSGILDALYSFGVYLYFIILACDILFAILLIITKSRILRIIFRYLSLAFSILSLLIALSFLLYIVVVVSTLIYEIGLMPVLKETGLLTALGFFVFGLIMAKKHLRWFKKPFPSRFYKKDRELSYIMK